MKKTVIYADHAATTALSPKAYEAMKPWLQDQYGNPSTLYSLAREPRKAIRAAREKIAALIGADPDEIFFTSGGTEADNWALKGTAFRYEKGKRIITSAIEHHAILNSCLSLERMGYRCGRLPVDREGLVSPDKLRETLEPDDILVSIMLANNEIGTIEPVQTLAKVAHDHGCLFHTDAVQAVGHIPINVKELGVDMLSASAHKFNGPKGVGFLYVKSGVELLPIIDGGGQEHGIRGGTENVAGIVGMATALEEHAEKMKEETAYLNTLSQSLVDELRKWPLDFIVNGSENRIPGSLSLSFRDADGEMILHRLDLAGIEIATGSACNSKETEVSHVIRAIGMPEEYANGTIRVTFGTDNSLDNIQMILEKIKSIFD